MIAAAVIGGAVGIGVAAGAAYLGVPLLARRRAVAAMRKACRETRSIVLSYDDGPGPGLTPRVLELLAAYGAKATLGHRAQAAPAMMDRIRAEGHEVGCHTFRHSNAWKCAPWTSMRDLHAGYRALAPWMADDGLFRPPYGKMTALSLLSARRRRAPVCWWTADSGDTHGVLPDARAVADGVVRDGGGVVLIHDFDRERDPAPRAAYVLEVTRALLDAGNAAGLRARTYSEVMRGAGGVGGV
jgi:peptidoglycan/xylan/chitin deacetylase (PgdA/CDA1 family)